MAKRRRDAGHGSPVAHGTRLGARRRRTGTCPISLEPLRSSKHVFVHDGASFDAAHLHAYLVANPDARNPLTRAEFTDAHVAALNAAVPDGVSIPTGTQRIADALRVRERDAMIEFLGDEARTLVVEILLLADEVNDFGTEDIDLAVTALRQVRRDVEQLSDGEAAWREICVALGKDYRGHAVARMTLDLAMWGDDEDEDDYVDDEYGNEFAVAVTTPPYAEISPAVAANTALN
jgi:hypothetical protein